MYSTGPPQPGAARGEPLRLAAAGRRAFAGSSAAALDPQLRVYLSDMVRPYQLALREDLIEAGSGQSYGEMAGALLPETVPDDQPVDLVVMAFALPDVIPGRSTAAHLSHLCPGSPTAFAVCDQGAAGPFTALRLIREYARAASCRRALLVVVEQAAVHYELAAPAPVPARHVAVMLMCGPAGVARLDAVRLRAGLRPAQAAGLLASDLATLAAGRPGVTLIAGNGLSDAGRPGVGPAGGPAVDTSAADQVRIAPAGQPVTGVWWELAGGLPGWTAAGRRVVLAEYDPILRYLCVSAVDIEASPAPAGGLAGQAISWAPPARIPAT